MDYKWTLKIDGMKIYTGEELQSILESVGFYNVQMHHRPKGWLCITAQKQA